ncbi:hypothetical protein H6F44_15445 [Pseudanabaena sp. FACHB-1277]|uniref:Uncharacterized protein n=1 Tax=Pseudanabaena cinerea FACHB-1277 TaxID=2949581 RepID=A0A926Z761_9CYAN|nr:hypothetical protein [Pseudanabaena cinerea]MBD2151503.1 hypothetical protein [Pseudanabaena cinerea FACHB-1277]
MSNTNLTLPLLHSLKAYAKTFAVSGNAEQLSAIASAILRFQPQEGALSLMSTDAVIQQVVQQFGVDRGLPDTLDLAIDSKTEQLIQGVHQWQRSLENQVLNTLNAYAQNFQTEQLQNLLPETVLSILPLVEDAQLHKSEFDFLLQQVKSKFNIENALGQVIEPQYLAIAQKLAKSLQLGNVTQLFEQQLLQGRLQGRSLVEQSVENLTESFVNQELEKFLGSDAVTVDIDVDAQQMMVKQVVLKLNMMQSSPPPVKSNADISKQLDQEVAKMQALRSQPISFSFQPPQ